jgi:hypothetical protein
VEPFLFIIPGIVGGLVVGLLAIGLGRRLRGPSDSGELTNGSLPTDVINMSSIKVSGIGGLGLVALSAVIALTIPRIGQSVAVGMTLGAIFALVLIVRRRRSGPMPSSGRHPGANATLSIDESTEPSPTPSQPASRALKQGAVVA